MLQPYSFEHSEVSACSPDMSWVMSWSLAGFEDVIRCQVTMVILPRAGLVGMPEGSPPGCISCWAWNSVGQKFWLFKWPASSACGHGDRAMLW